MVLTVFGILAAGICLLMLFFKRPLREFFVVLIVSGVFGAAEAVGLPMLGGSSLTVPNFCVMLVFARVLFAAQKQPKMVGEAIGANIWLLLFVAYGVVVAFTMPRLFEGSMSVFAMRASPYRTLLTFTPQNITQAVYLVLTGLAAIAGYLAARSPKGDQSLIFAWSLASAAFVLFGLVDLAGFYGGGLDLMKWARTASYSMLSQSDNGLKRISGSFSESSSFATFGAVPLTLFSCFWLVDIRRSISSLLAVALAVLLALSTSSTAFLMIAVVLLLIAIGGVTVPMSPKVRRRKFVSLGAAVVVACVGLALLAFLSPKFVSSFSDVFEAATIGKSKSLSAIERGTWAAQGPEAFRISKGLGVGPGSFRSSGLAQAVLGSTGVAGSLCLTLYVLKLAGTLFRKTPYADRRIVTASALASVLALVPQLAVLPSPDPGIIFGAMAGFTLGRQKKAQLESKEQKALLAENDPVRDSRFAARAAAPNFAR